MIVLYVSAILSRFYTPRSSYKLHTRYRYMCVCGIRRTGLRVCSTATSYPGGILDTIVNAVPATCLNL